jgi:metal-responsive CopG/Arc/MetJ family transcriptional regulator
MAAKHADDPRPVVTSRIERPLLDELDKLADEDRRSRSEMIEQAVRELVERRRKKKK